MRIVMDDAGDAPAELLKQYNIYVVPINIMFGTEQFLSEITMTHAEFYEKVQAVTDANFPKTSQPTPTNSEEAYRMILAAGESEILTVTVSNRLSGTYASAAAAIRELEGEGTFHLFDSQAGSAAQGLWRLRLREWHAMAHRPQQFWQNGENARRHGDHVHYRQPGFCTARWSRQQRQIGDGVTAQSQTDHRGS